MKSFLPNMRWVTLPSEAMGEDWASKALQIDNILQDFGLDLAEENVFLLFDRAPGAVMHGEGQCLIARSVIGPKRELAAPFKVTDWVAASVFRRPLKANTWSEALEQAMAHWEELQRQGQKLGSGFFLRLKRRLGPELSLQTEVLFSE